MIVPKSTDANDVKQCQNNKNAENENSSNGLLVQIENVIIIMDQRTSHSWNWWKMDTAWSLNLSFLSYFCSEMIGWN